MCVPESIGQDSPNNPNYQTLTQHLKDYQFVIGSKNVPSLPVSLSRIHGGLVDPLHLIELQKGLEQTSIKVKNLLKFADLFLIARSLGRYNNSFNLNVNTLRLKLSYSSQPADAQIIHNFIYHVRTINISKNGKKVIM